MNFKLLVLPAGALAAAGILLTPSESVGFSTIGGSLSQSQRDFRVYDNFSGSGPNNNTTPDPSWPGYTGAEMAIWKGCAEWSSVPHGGAGAGDPTQPQVGGSGANFDPSWQGNATSVGTSNNNIHSEISGSSGGVLAYCETPISDGWRIRYYSTWSWQDGPGTVSTGIDLQGVACHEYGHALGLGHSSVGQTTMFASISGTGQGQRSIEDDDVAGVQFVYGVVDNTVKPRITGVDLVGGTLTVIGNNFATNNNEVWFTQAGTGGNGTPIKVTGLNATSNSIITAVVPGTAGPGDVMVKQGGNSGHSGLSNLWPFDPAQAPNPPATEVNIDLGVTAGTPGTGQGGVPGNTGAWNGVDLPTEITSLFDLSLVQTTGTFGDSSSAGEFFFDEPASTGFYAKLFDDGHDIGCTGSASATYTFDGFAPGLYDVYVYSWALEDPVNSLTDITVVGGSKGTQTCGGIPFQTSLIDGGNYVVDQVTIGSGGTIQVTAARNMGCARVNGFQILPGTACGLPVSYCTPGTSASGCQATMSATGTPSASAPSGFTVMADDVEGQKDALFFYGTNGQQANSWGNGTSYQCIVPPVTRAGLLSGNGNVGACDAAFAQDFNALWSANPSKNPGAGAAVNVQLWYRDPMNTSNQTTSLSDGLSFVVCP